jgi:hypothetical protein
MARKGGRNHKFPPISFSLIEIAYGRRVAANELV